jgi:polysaccharide pyruvyl transferase WcaK-like protein
MTAEVVLYYGTYLNKGGAAIAYGTLTALQQLGIDCRYIVDPEPFQDGFFNQFNLHPIYRYADAFASQSLPSLNMAHTIGPLIKCVANSLSPDVRGLRGFPLWHIGDSPFSDRRSIQSLVGQIISLETLRAATHASPVIFGGVSIDYPTTSIGQYLTKRCFKNYYFFARGNNTRSNLLKLGVDEQNITIIADFAFQLDGRATDRTESLRSITERAQKPLIALCLRDYGEGQRRARYLNSILRLTKLIEQDFGILYVPTSYSFLEAENDYLFLKRALGVKDAQIINIKDLTPWEIITVFSHVDAVVSARLHGAVYGTLANTPTIHLYDSGKSLEVLRDVFGQNVPLVSFGAFTDGSGIEAIIEALYDLIDAKANVAAVLKSCVQRARKESLQTLKTTLGLRNLLGGD